MHGFHVAHHANYKCNMNLAGFFGIPLADLVLGTYKQPDPMLIDGAPATKALARDLTPNPHWPISVFDAASVKRRRRMQKEADARKAAKKKRATPAADALAAGSSRVHDQVRSATWNVTRANTCKGSTNKTSSRGSRIDQHADRR